MLHGVAFGAVAVNPEATIPYAIALSVGIGIQNFSRVAVLAMPLRKEGTSPLVEEDRAIPHPCIGPIVATVRRTINASDPCTGQTCQ